MAARKKLPHVQKTRDRIQATQIINRLEKHIFAEKGVKGYTKALMTSAQVTAALGLLKKTIPDLAVIDAKVLMEHSGQVEVKTTVKHELADNFKQWEFERERRESANVQH